ncbi:MAG: NADH-quinone oxidoreductase subunit C [Balneolales bacterium]|nr:NADH-quinone oxidoreductase subunit C [Balneolales bacterium]
MSRTEKLQSVIEDLKNQFEGDIIEIKQHAGDQQIRVSLNKIHDVCEYLFQKHHFAYLVDVFGADRFTSEDRFEVIYHIVSLKTGVRIFLKTWCSEENPVVPTVTDIWEGANWNEREVWDMFGIRFEGHPDLRRIFMPEDFTYHPLRKEFPLLGIPGSIDLPTTTPDSE